MKSLMIPIFLFGLSLPCSAHEMWLEPRSLEDSPYQVDLVVGQDFSGSRGVWIPTNVVRAEWINDQGAQPIQSRYGDIPAISLESASAGDRVVYESQPELLRYSNSDKFQTFGQHKGYPDLYAQHQARGLSGRIVEAYSRHAKLLVGKFQNDAQDGLRIEFVVDADQSAATLFYQQAPLAGHQVILFQGQQQRIERTDAQGRVALDLVPGVPALLDAVVIEAVDPSGRRGIEQAQWFSYWASTYLTPR